MTRAVLAWLAAGAALLATIAGSPYAADHTAVDVKRLATEVAREEDHVTALELAQWIRDRKAGLRIVDLRDSAAFDDYHLPRSERIAIEDLPSARFAPEETIVLISEAGGHAAQGWVLLQVAGHRNAFFLRGGIAEWVDDVMTPTLAVNATPAEAAAFQPVSALSRYFGGSPHVAGTHTTTFQESTKAAAPSADIRGLRRRGC